MAELIFYKHKHGRLLDRLIGWLTFGDYSHVEFKLTDGPTAPGPCLSSSWRDGGVRGKVVDLGSGKWRRYLISPQELSLCDELEISEWFREQEGLKYDTLGVLLVAFTWWSKKLLRRKRWFCSEICSYICKRWRIFNFPTTQISPSRLERICRHNPMVFRLVLPMPGPNDDTGIWTKPKA
jgi:hypothetical protein